MLVIGVEGIKNSILETIGNTPLVRLNSISQRIYAKLEFMNPGGSIKDRTALFMIEDAEKRGLLKKIVLLLNQLQEILELDLH